MARPSRVRPEKAVCLHRMVTPERACHRMVTRPRACLRTPAKVCNRRMASRLAMVWLASRRRAVCPATWRPASPPPTCRRTCPPTWRRSRRAARRSRTRSVRRARRWTSRSYADTSSSRAFSGTWYTCDFWVQRAARSTCTATSASWSWRRTSSIRAISARRPPTTGSPSRSPRSPRRPVRSTRWDRGCCHPGDGLPRCTHPRRSSLEIIIQLLIIGDHQILIEDPHRRSSEITHQPHL